MLEVEPTGHRGRIATRIGQRDAKNMSG